MNFEWDPEKAQSNLRKHGVNFAEAMTVFKDPLALIFDDEEHSQEEHREIIMGTSALSRIVLVFLSNESKIPSVFSARATQLKKRPKTMKKNARKQAP